MCGQVSLPTDADDLAIWQRVVATPELIAHASTVAATADDPGYVARVARMRATWPLPDVAVALALAEARRRAKAKFPDAARLVCDPQGVEQASSSIVATWKADRFARHARTVQDLCCGMGGDTMALASRSATVGVDRSPLRAWMAGLNANVATRVADVIDARFPGELVHIDPARRIEASGVRTRTPFHIPSIEACVAIVRSADGGAIKLGPGTEPALVPQDATLEWISEDGILVQMVVWLGALAEGPVRIATLLSADRTSAPVTRSGTVEAMPQIDGWRSMLAVPDPALERSRLLGGFAREHGLAEPAAGLGIVTADAIPPSPWLERSAILATQSANERAVADALRQLGATRARVRTRGASADADAWTRALARRLGPAPVGEGCELDVFILRTGDERVALIARRID